MLHRKLPKNSGQCATPIQNNLLLGQKLQINGTPTLFLKNGIRIAGMPQNVEQIEQLLNSVEQPE